MSIWTYRGLRGGVKTVGWPLDEVPGMKGLPVPNVDRCPEGCDRCARSCPTEAITIDEGAVELDHGACIDCNLCVEECPFEVLTRPTSLTRANSDRDALRRSYNVEPAPPTLQPTKGQRRLRKSLFVRHIDCGSCNGCESEIAALDNPYYNLHRFGVFFTPSPRFADVLLVTGPVTSPMYDPLVSTYEAMPEPKYVIATGVCAISGGTNGGGYNAHRGLGGVVPVDLWLPGCPPHPAVIADALLALVGRA